MSDDLSYGGLRRLVSELELHDYTRLIVENPGRFGATYMIRPGSATQLIAHGVASFVPQLFPSFIWVLQRPADSATNESDAPRQIVTAQTMRKYVHQRKPPRLNMSRALVKNITSYSVLQALQYVAPLLTLPVLTRSLGTTA